MEDLKVSGPILEIGEIQSFPSKTGSEPFTKREFVLSVGDRYPKPILFQVTKDRCAYLDGCKAGETIDVSFNLDGRAWTSPKTGEVKHFVSLDVWKLSRAEGAEKAPAAAPTAVVQGQDDDIPF